jgi:serine/threonine-protein kinase
MIGRTIGKYRIVEQIGRGGMGVVYRAIDETLDRPVAIKALHADLISAESVKRFRNEAVTLAKLNHPRIATIHELTQEGDDVFMVMEYVAGETCEKLLTRTGPLTVARSVALCLQVLDALEHAHRAGIVHRDLKPSNVMVLESGDVKVMDFGIARVIGSQHLTSDGFMMGTPAYMPPEQVRGEEIDRRADLYATTVMLYQILTLHLPFEAATAFAIIHRQLTSSPTPPRQFRVDMPEWIDSILARGLARAPADRFQTAAEFRTALTQGIGGTVPWPVTHGGSDAETIGPMPTPISVRAPVPTASVAQQWAPAARADTTVTLRTPHLAAAGTLLGLLVIGVGVLAYAALRRPMNPMITATPGKPPAADAPASRGPGELPSSRVAPAAPGPGELSSTSSSQSIAAPPPIAGNVQPKSGGPGIPGLPGPVRGGPPSPTGSGPAAGGPPVPPSQARPSTGAAAAIVTAASRSGSLSSAAASSPVGGTSLPGPAAPSAAVAEKAGVDAVQSFGDIKLLLAEGEKTTDHDALLTFERGELIVRSRDTGAILKSLPYTSIAAATYSQSRRPRWQEDAGLTAISRNLGGSGFFLRASKHWLALQTTNDYLIVRLDDKNVRPILSSLESRTGRKVQRE